MSKYDPYACGPQCGCDPCDEPKPLEVIITAGPPINEPDPCRELPIAYDATNGCFYLWDNNTGWFEATGIEFEVTDSDPNGTGDTLVLTKCNEETRFFNSRNTGLRLERRGDNEVPWLIIEQTHGPNVEVNLSTLDSYVNTFDLLNPAEGVYRLRLTQTAGRPTHLVDLPFVHVDDLPPQTRVTRGDGSVRAGQTITANHQGTWPNTVWRESYVVRNGDVANIHLWDPADNAWDVVSVYAPENIVILNNPTFYIRQATGSPNPPIESQDDLTIANAFDSFVSMFQFINRSNIIGDVTIDVRGNFDAADRSMAWTPSDFKNAAVVVLRGDPADVNAFRLNIQSDTPSNVGPVAGGGLNLTIRDMRVHHTNSHTNATGGQAFRASENSQLHLRGHILFTGTINMNRVGAGGSWYAFNAVGGTISLGGFNAPESLTLDFDMTAGSLFSGILRSQQGGSISVNDIRGDIARDVASTHPTIHVTGASNIEAYGLPSDPGAGGVVFTGANFTADYALQMLINSFTTIGGSPYFTQDYQALLAAMHMVGAANLVRMDQYSYLVSAYGSQLTGDPLVTVI